jgi:hypothetical protein
LFLNVSIKSGVDIALYVHPDETDKENHDEQRESEFYDVGLTNTADQRPQ